MFVLTLAIAVLLAWYGYTLLVVTPDPVPVNESEKVGIVHKLGDMSCSGGWTVLQDWSIPQSCDVDDVGCTSIIPKGKVFSLTIYFISILPVRVIQSFEDYGSRERPL